MIEGEGLYAVPGFIDPHVHLESSMVCVAEYARAVLPRGTTMIAADPHEMGNVLGAPGMRVLLDEAAPRPCGSGCACLAAYQPFPTGSKPRTRR